jgi:mannose-6-phosphate isomerase-like protein (cupin superfamily)
VDIFQVEEIERRRARLEWSYLEFLRVPSLSVGVYSLGAGEEDRQQPHMEDEVYYVAAGRASIRVGDEDQAVRTGSVVYVPAGVEHHFHDIAEDLTLIVFFAPGEGTASAPGEGTASPPAEGTASAPGEGTASAPGEGTASA